MTTSNRTAQLKRRRSDLCVETVSGELDARLALLHEGHLEAVVMSAETLVYLDRLDIVTEFFDTDLLIPGPGQGALALEARQADARTAELLRPLDDEATAYAVRAERTCLARIGAQQDDPVGVYAETDGTDMAIHGVVARLDGTRAARLRWSGPWREPDDVGTTLGELLIEIGAREILSGQPMRPTTRYDRRRPQSPERWQAPYPEEEA